MKRSRFTEEQIIAILGEHEAGVRTVDVCRKTRPQRSDFPQMEVEVRRSRGIRGEASADARDGECPAEELLAEAMLDNAMLKDIASKMVTPVARREAVAHLRQSFEVSQRRACQTIGADRPLTDYSSDFSRYRDHIDHYADITNSQKVRQRTHGNPSLNSRQSLSATAAPTRSRFPPCAHLELAAQPSVDHFLIH